MALLPASAHQRRGCPAPLKPAQQPAAPRDVIDRAPPDVECAPDGLGIVAAPAGAAPAEDTRHRFPPFRVALSFRRNRTGALWCYSLRYTGSVLRARHLTALLAGRAASTDRLTQGQGVPAAEAQPANRRQAEGPHQGSRPRPGDPPVRAMGSRADPAPRGRRAWRSGVHRGQRRWPPVPARDAEHLQRWSVWATHRS